MTVWDVIPSPPPPITAIILAAGCGRRLGHTIPKALLEFGGKTLLERHIATLHAHGIHDISITVGYQSEAIRREVVRLQVGDAVALVENPNYHQGSLVSLWVQRERLKAGTSIVLMDADVLYDPQIIGRLLDAKPQNVLLLDQTIEPGDEPVKICLRGGLLVDFAKKPVRDHDWHGESVGFFRFTAATATALADRVDRYVWAERTSVEYEEAIRDLILARPDQFGYEDISDLPWTEIDFDVDVARARDEVLPKISELVDVETPLLDAGDSDAAPSELGPLSGQQVKDYGEAGWLLARGFFKADEVAAISRWTNDLAALPEVPGKQMVYHEPSLIEAGGRVIQRIENFCPYHPEFDGLVRASRLSVAVEQLFDAPAYLFKEKINFKMPGGAGFEAHQDQQAGWSRYASLFVTALVTIDRATMENGCLEMADAPRFAGLIGEEWRPLSAAEMAGFKLVPVPTEPGDVLFFDSFAPHASKPNLTKAPRRILYLTYNLASEGDHRVRYFADKRANFPPDIERTPGVEYKFRV